VVLANWVRAAALRAIAAMWARRGAHISLRNIFMNKFGIAILSITLFLAACEDPAANKTRALTSDASSTANNSRPETVAGKGENLAITPDNSKVLFTGSKVTGKHDGGFNQFTGEIDLVNGKVEDSGVRIDIETSSVFTDADGLTKHLQTGDFFEIEKFPKASFVSTKIVPNTDQGENSYTVSGDLELRGVKKGITFPATIVVSPAEVKVDSEFSVNRKDFGIVYAGKADDLIRDDVVIKLDLKAPRKQ
jgi:polyisoprenoid-binding protein YceI